jgi:P27 family predicted phage terminase small subunit
MPVDPIGPPDDLDKDARALYRKIRTYLREQATWADSDMYLLGQTCRYEMRAREARASIPLEDGKPVMTTRGRSENSGDVAHPAVRIAEAAEKSFVDCLKELGLTPRARTQLGLETQKKGAGSKFGF